MKILPAIHVPRWIWIWGVIIAMIKSGNIVWGYAAKKQFISLHTVMNKIAGLLLFLLPLTLSFVELKYSSIVVCSITTFASIQEGVYIVIGCEKSKPITYALSNRNRGK
jgi:CDP-diacylglycerol--glycerol-3-phosphate 3-phosphatidyltransferase